MGIGEKVRKDLVIAGFVGISLLSGIYITKNLDRTVENLEKYSRPPVPEYMFQPKQQYQPRQHYFIRPVPEFNRREPDVIYI